MFKKNKRKEKREFLANISMYLLNEEKMKKLFWNVKTVEYKRVKQTLRIGINTHEKLGTVMQKLRTLRKGLAEYLYEQGLTDNSIAKVEFFVDREDELLEKIYEIIDKVEKVEVENS
jgi:hypothetical protein